MAQYQVFCGDQVFVIWHWIWLEGGEQSESSSEICSGEEHFSNFGSESDRDESEDEPKVPAITHSVIFKCIGVTKEKHYQELLALANRKINNGEAVPVKLQKEPTNCYDSRAIAFMCKADKDWERIGYVVSEALPDVHKAMDSNKILGVRFDWVKLKFPVKNPGWYAGITVTLNGTWSKTVSRCCSTFQ